MEAEPRFVEQQYGILMTVSRFGKENDEERNQPLEALRALVQLDFDAQFVLYDDLEILLVGFDTQAISLGFIRVRPPNLVDARS